MKGTTHLTIGAAIGGAAAAHYADSPATAAIYLLTSVISALSADLDGASLMTSKLGKLSKALYAIIHITGWLLLGAAGYFLLTNQDLNIPLTTLAATLILTGLIVSQGFIRNLLVSVVGVLLIYIGIRITAAWLIGFGAFVLIAPWFKHRGMTHTIWALIAWTLIGYGFEQYLQLEGIMRIAFLGYLSHLLADMLTPSGVKWLYPLIKKSFKLV